MRNTTVICTTCGYMLDVWDYMERDDGTLWFFDDDPDGPFTDCPKCEHPTLFFPEDIKADRAKLAAWCEAAKP